MCIRYHLRDARDAVTKLSKLSCLTTLTIIEEGVYEHRLGRLLA